MAEQHQNMQQQHHQQGQNITAQILNVQGGVATLGDSTPIQIMMPTGVVNVMEEHQQVPHHVQEMQEVVQEAVGGTQDPPEDPKLTNKKELSKQWKSLCKRAKQWCSMHDDSVPNFVMMYLDENRLVWEGPDHMESFISDEGVISAFLRTAALSESLIGMEKRGADDIQETAQRPAKKQKSAETASTSKKGMTDEEVIASILEKPEAESQDSTQDMGAGGDENDSDSGAGQAAEGHQPSQSTSEGPSQGGEGDVLSQVIESVIKEWAPGQGPPPRTGEEEGDGNGQGNVMITICKQSEPNAKKMLTVSQASSTNPPSAHRPTPPPLPSSVAVEKGSLETRSDLPLSLKDGSNEEDYSEDAPYKPLVFAKCDVCRRKLPKIYMEEHLQLHVEKKLGEQSSYVSCKVCCETIEWCALERHMNQHNQNGDAQYEICDVCLNPVKSRYYRKHLLIHDQRQPGRTRNHKCEKCPKAFWEKAHLDSHMHSHLPHGLNTCGICGKSYKQKLDLKRHTRKVHLGDLPYKCSQCDKAFVTVSKLKRHDMVHKNIRPYQCDQCNKTYIAAFELNQHVRTVHEKKLRPPTQKEKRFICEVCQRGFAKGAHLSEHMKIHTGEKPYVCEVCEQRFKHKSSMTKHMLRHTGEMPHSCKFCGKRFRANSSMHYHIRKHHKKADTDIEFCCCVCSQVFENESSLQTHLKMHDRKVELNLPRVVHITQSETDIVTSCQDSASMNTAAITTCTSLTDLAGTASVHYITLGGVSNTEPTVATAEPTDFVENQPMCSTISESETNVLPQKIVYLRFPRNPDCPVKVSIPTGPDQEYSSIVSDGDQNYLLTCKHGNLNVELLSINTLLS